MVYVTTVLQSYTTVFGETNRDQKGDNNMCETKRLLLNIIPVCIYVISFIVKIILLFIFKIPAIESNIMIVEWLSLMFGLPIYYTIANCRNNFNKMSGQYNRKYDNILRYMIVVAIMMMEFFITIIPTWLRIDYVDNIGKSILILVAVTSIIVLTIAWFVRALVFYFQYKK